MSKGRKKRKHKPKKPPLTPLNKFLYWLLFFVGIMLIFSPMLFATLWQQKIGRENGAIATTGTAYFLFILLPLFPAIVVGAVLFSNGYTDHVPIVPPRKKPLMKPKKKKSPTFWLCIILAVVLWLATFIPVIGSVYNRVEINKTHIVSYGMFGRLKEYRSLEDATAVHARIYYGSSGRYARSWKMTYTIRFADGEKYTFEKVPDVMIQIDNLFPDVPKTVEGVENFDKLCEEYDCTPEERERLKELFLIEIDAE